MHKFKLINVENNSSMAGLNMMTKWSWAGATLGGL